MSNLTKCPRNTRDRPGTRGARLKPSASQNPQTSPRSHSSPYTLADMNPISMHTEGHDGSLSSVRRLLASGPSRVLEDECMRNEWWSALALPASEGNRGSIARSAEIRSSSNEAALFALRSRMACIAYTVARRGRKSWMVVDTRVWTYVSANTRPTSVITRKQENRPRKMEKLERTWGWLNLFSEPSCLGRCCPRIYSSVKKPQPVR